MNSTATSSNFDTKHLLRRFALRVAGPRDLAINLIVNGGIAWLLYGGYPEVPLVTGHSIFSMLLPMTFILSFCTTFFGYFNGVQFIKSLPPADRPPAHWPWLGQAIRLGFSWGAIGALVVFALQLICQQYAFGWSFSAASVVVAIGLYAGLLAYVLHTLAVMRAGKLFD